MQSFTITGRLIDVHQRRTYGVEIRVANGKIAAINEIADPGNKGLHILPGFVDAHIHIESSMVLPVAFAHAAIKHGTVATVSDPHEIANVCGLEGVRYMIENAGLTNFKFFFGAPSCVPATMYETAGAAISAPDVAALLSKEDIWYLSEMMNYPGVLQRQPEVMDKIAASKKAGKPVDGHAPGLTGENAANYASAGISTDHECVSLEEAADKIKAGMHILIREGSAARNYPDLHELLVTHPAQVMFCSDDKHPDELLQGHINLLVKRSLANGYNLYDVLRAASLNPVQHYKLPVGLLRVNDPADFIVINNPEDFDIQQAYIDGMLVYDGDSSRLPQISAEPINNFAALPVKPAAFALTTDKYKAEINVIEALEGQLITRRLREKALIENGCIISDPANDVLKLAVVNRYTAQSTPAIAFIKNFGLKRGAIASTIAHDCHNIIAVGADDESICAAVNALIVAKGGIAVAITNKDVHILPLPVAGLMSAGSVEEVARQYILLNEKAKELGCTLQAPFMTLSFMALLVIPSLKLSDKGLFDGETFNFIDVIAQ